MYTSKVLWPEVKNDYIINDWGGTEPGVNVFVCSQNNMRHFQTWKNTHPSLNQKRRILIAKYETKVHTEQRKANLD